MGKFSLSLVAVLSTGYLTPGKAKCAGKIREGLVCFCVCLLFGKLSVRTDPEGKNNLKKFPYFLGLDRHHIGRRSRTSARAFVFHLRVYKSFIGEISYRAVSQRICSSKLESKEIWECLCLLCVSILTDDGRFPEGIEVRSWKYLFEEMRFDCLKGCCSNLTIQP